MYVPPLFQAWGKGRFHVDFHVLRWNGVFDEAELWLKIQEEAGRFHNVAVLSDCRGKKDGDHNKTLIRRSQCWFTQGLRLQDDGISRRLELVNVWNEARGEEEDILAEN